MVAFRLYSGCPSREGASSVKVFFTLVNITKYLTKLWGLHQEDLIFQAFDASVDIVGGVWMCEMMGRDPRWKWRGA
jgi:hypothetical protein